MISANILSAFFVLITGCTVVLLYGASGKSKRFFLFSLVWLIIQALLGMTGFYLTNNVDQPRLVLLPVIPVIIIVLLFSTNRGREYVDKFDPKTLTWLHTVRVPVEISLFCLYLQGLIPESMTFEGRNLDIFSGISAGVIAYFGYTRNKLSTGVILAWNFLCLILLFNIVVTGLLSAPSPIQQLAFDQPNIGVLQFPYVWLPSFIVPAVLFSHLVSIRALLLAGNKYSRPLLKNPN